MELYASDMFFHGDNEKEQAYRFLHTIFENHFMGAEDFDKDGYSAFVTEMYSPIYNKKIM